LWGILLLRERFPNKEYFYLKELRKAIIVEVGGDNRTIKKYIRILLEIEYLKRLDRWKFKDLGKGY